MISTGREWLHWVASRLRRCPGLRQGIAADSSRSRNGIDAVGSTLNDPERNHLHLTGRPTRFAAQATNTNSGQVLLRLPKFPPTSPETTRTASFGTPSTPAMSSRCRITPPPALV